MKFKFLGTAAFEGIPALFCNCMRCRQVRKTGGKSVRTRTQAIIDDNLLIDFPADTVSHVLSNNLDLSGVRNCLITHSHSDHLYVEDITILGDGFAFASPDYTMTFYATEKAGKGIEKILGDITKARLHTVKAFDVLSVDKYTVTVLPAIHDETSGPVIYQITDGEKTVLYALDTHFPRDDIWEYWEKNKPHFDLVVMDCTNALRPMNYIGHMSLFENVGMKKRMTEMGIADEKTAFVSNHFSHNGLNVPYEEFSPEAAKEGILTSYDGMEICL
ncbi:MAG: hypothetical protein IKX77_02225 [Clostridia bacterium]|nr:hypothetical protein [Clostridia bacterium]